MVRGHGKYDTFAVRAIDTQGFLQNFHKAKHCTRAAVGILSVAYVDSRARGFVILALDTAKCDPIPTGSSSQHKPTEKYNRFQRQVLGL